MENERDNSVTQEKGTLGFKITLGILGVCILGLIGGIVWVGVGRNDDDEVLLDEDVVEAEESVATVMYANGNNEIKKGTGESFELSMQYYDELSAAATNNEEYYLVESTRVSVLLENGYEETSILYLDNIDESRLNIAQLQTIYKYYSVAYADMGEMPKSDYYKKKSDEMLNEMMYSTLEEM